MSTDCRDLNSGEFAEYTRFDHRSVLPEPMAEVLQTVISSSTGDLLFIVPVIAVDRISDTEVVFRINSMLLLYF
jgi:hypothetical protein